MTATWMYAYADIAGRVGGVTSMIDEAGVDALLTALLDHGLERVAAEHRPAVTAALRRMLNSDQPGVVAQHLTRGSRPERFGQHWDHKPTLLRAFARGGRVADEHARDRLRHLGSATSLTRPQVARRLRDMMEILDLDATALAEEAERLRVADHDDLFDRPSTHERITPASVNRVLEGAAPPRPGQLAFILRAAHMDVGRVQGSEDA